MGWLNFWGPAVECLSVGAVPPYAVAFGTSGYVMRSEDGGANWRQCYTRENADGTSSSIGLETTCLHEIVPDRECAGRFFLCYYDVGLFVTEDGGATWRKVFSEKFCSRPIFLSDGRWAVSMNENPYHDSYRGKGVAISANSGATWKNLSDGSLLVPNVSCLAENPRLPGELWAGTDGASVFVRKVKP